MNLTFLGRGAAFNTKERNTNAYFTEGERLFLIDCGETAFFTLRERGVLDKMKEVYVVVSHTHGDHAGSLGSLGLYCQFMLGTKLKVVMPHDDEYVESIRTLMTIFGNTDKAYEIIYEEEIDNVFETFSTVRYGLTKHDRILTSYSFTFETPEGAVFYSADTRITDNILNFIEVHEKIDKIYMEVTDTESPEDIHLNIGALERALEPVFPRGMRSKIHMMHLRGDSVIEKIEEAGFNIVKL